MMTAYSLLLHCAPLAAGCLQPIGSALESARSASSVLEAASRIEPPGPPFAKVHLSQDVHQVKRQKLACNALARLAKLLVGSKCDAERHIMLRDQRLADLLMCAAEPSSARADGDDASLDAQSARVVAGSLTALAALCAADAVYCAQKASWCGVDKALLPLQPPARLLATRAESLCGDMCLTDCVSSRWSVRRLLGTTMAMPSLDRRVAALPYDFIPGLISLPVEAPADDPDSSTGDHVVGSAFLPSMGKLIGQLTATGLHDSLPFEQQALLTADGRSVRERRHTCWLAEEGIGALAYSGKSSAAIAAARGATKPDGTWTPCLLCAGGLPSAPLLLHRRRPNRVSARPINV